MIALASTTATRGLALPSSSGAGAATGCDLATAAQSIAGAFRSVKEKLGGRPSCHASEMEWSGSLQFWPVQQGMSIAQ